MEKRGQVTLFIILAIAIIGAIAGYAVFKYYQEKIPTKFEPVGEYFLECAKLRLREGASILGQKGGYIDVPEFEPGSLEYPTSNHLDFMGDSVPYWMYVSGNGIMKEQVPTIDGMEQQLSNYMKETLVLCDFSEFYNRNYGINLSVNKISTRIQEGKIRADIDADLIVSFGNDTAKISSHQVEIDSKLKKFYDVALDVYEKEKKEMFLENFTIDILYLYAPTTDTETSCSPKVWLLENVSRELKEAFEGNLLFLRQNAKDKYYNVDIKTDENLRFLYMRDWPTKIYTPNDNGLLVAKPVGNQPGLGVLGFCIVPYHFVYDVVYPVLIQVYDEDEFFQFPINVVIRGNKPRQPLETEAVYAEKEIVCKYKNTPGKVYTYDSELNPIEADISFKCFSEVCSIGKTKLIGEKAFLEDNFPQCINGLVYASAEGHLPGEETVSSNSEFDVGIILDNLYTLNLDVKPGSGKNAMIYFESGKLGASRAVYWPEQTSVNLAEGFYNVTAYVYSDADIILPEVSSHKCIEIPYPGISGLLGRTTEKCFDVSIPEQKITNAIIGGGKSKEYFLASQLKSGNKLEIFIPYTKIPKSVDDIQEIYDKIERTKLDMHIK